MRYDYAINISSSQRIQSELDKLGIPYRVVGRTGIIATLEEKQPGKTLALRADIDGKRLGNTKEDSVW